VLKFFNIYGNVVPLTFAEVMESLENFDVETEILHNSKGWLTWGEHEPISIRASPTPMELQPESNVANLHRLSQAGRGDQMTLTLHIRQDIDPESPREWDNLGTMVCFHSRYGLGDESRLRSDSFSGWDEVEDYLREEFGAEILLPLYLYDHGGLTMRTSPFSCPWDSGQVGFIYTTRERVLKDYNKKRLTKSLREKAEASLRTEVETYDQFLRGEVYGFVIEDEDGEHVDSCWGFFGEDYCREQGESVLKWHQERAA
jgi:hypothetical protein